MYIYACAYIYREREREREMCVYTHCDIVSGAAALGREAPVHGLARAERHDSIEYSMLYRSIVVVTSKHHGML